MLSKNVHKISCMGYELVPELGQKVGQMISKSEEKLWDIDIKNFTVSPLDQIKCSPALYRSDIQLPSNLFEILCRPNPEWMMVLPSSVAVRMDGRAKNIATCHKLRGDASERADE